MTSSSFKFLFYFILVQGLSQHHKRLHSLAEHVPHGFRKKHLFEVLIRHNVPLLRATWFIKVTYLNQVGTVLNCVDFLVILYSYFSTSLCFHWI